MIDSNLVDGGSNKAKNRDSRSWFSYSARTKSKFFRSVLSFTVAVAAVVSCSQISAATNDEGDDTPIEFHGPPPHPGYPDPFRLDYVLLQSMMSPNGDSAVVFPTMLLEGSPDFIIDLKNSRVISVIPTDEPYFRGKNHASLSVSWSPDSSMALIEVGGRWSPNDLILIELKDGKVGRQTDVLAPLQKLFAEARIKPEHRKIDNKDAADITMGDLKWEGGKLLDIKCSGETNPKEFDDADSWTGDLSAVWDIAQRKFVQHKFANVSFRRGHRGE